MKKYLFIVFSLVGYFISAQTELVRWTKNNLSSTTASHVSAPDLTAAGGISISPTTWDQSFFMISGLSSSSTIDLTKYVQVAIAPGNNYKLTLGSLNLRYRNQGGTSKFEIKYSTNADFSSPQTLFSSAVTDGNWHDLSQSNFANPTLLSGKTMYIRLYVYETYNSFHLSYTPNGGTGTGPNITGTVAADNPSAPIATDDAFTVPKNNDGDFNILSNDVSASVINSINITQQPAHGTLTLNGTANVIYKPTIGYIGTDSFKYTATNSIGTSNIATATINVIENADAPLVRWNNANYTPSFSNTHLLVGNMTSTANLSYTPNVTVNGVNYGAFQTTGWPDKNAQTIDTSKYIQFTISPKAGYKLNLSEFNFLCVMQAGDANLRIDYSLNSSFSNPVTLLPQTTINSSLSTISLTNFSKPIATDGQVLYLRVYVYNTWNAMQILLKDGQSFGPLFSGNVEYSSTVPIAYNDTITDIINNDLDINVLVNDDYSNKVTALTFTQPSHGTTKLNADNSINYIPAQDFTGADSFTYYITNQYGVSNVATVNINVVANTKSPLIRWDKTDFTATSFQSFINATTITSSGAVGIAVGGETNPRTYYVEGSGDNTILNPSRYIQFVVDNTSAKKTIEPKTFSYVARGTDGAKYEIRYSKNANFTNDYVVLGSGNVPVAYTTQTFNFDDGLKLEPGEKLYVRLYLYNSYYVQYVMQFITGGSGPEIDGLFYNNVYSPNNTIWLNSNSPHWSNGLPNATRHAIIDTDYNTATNGNFESNNLTINPGANLTIKNQGYVKVNGQITNNAATANFTVDDNGNLLQVGTAQNVGNVTVKKGALLPKMGYNYWSSPVIGQNLYQFSDGYNTVGATGSELGTPWNRFYVYNEANDHFVSSLANDITLSATSVFQPARGYAIRGKNSFPTQITSSTPSTTFEFKGVPQNGDVSFMLKYTDSAHGYNMVGNPYPSNIYFDDFFAVNSTKINGVLFLWTNNDSQVTTQQGSNYVSNNYALYNRTGGTSATYLGYNNRKPNGYISVGQGFIVQAKATGKNQPLIFNNAMRGAGNANFYNKNGENKSDPKDRFWIEFKSPTNVNNEILIGYLPDATNEYDANFDTELLSVGNDSFWSVLDNKKLGIQARQASFNADDVVKLAVKASVSGNFTISITDKEGIFIADQDILLKDSYLNKVVNLNEGAYVFNTNAGQYEDRFQIIYKLSQTLSTGSYVKKGIEIYKDVQNFIIKADENLDEVSMYDSVGRLIFKTNNAKKEVLISNMNLSEGMYIIKTISRNTTMTKKVLK